MQLHLTKKELDNNSGSGGLEIYIPSVIASPTDAPDKKCPIFIEYYEGQIHVRVWDGKEDPTTITLTNRG
jgi:hypothetical protein